MKLTKLFKPVILLAVIILIAGCSTAGNTAGKMPQKNNTTYLNTTEIPENITTPDVVETSIGTLHFLMVYPPGKPPN